VLLASGCVLGLTASRAVADQVPVVLQYSCQLPIVGGTSLAATVVWPSALQTATVGTRTPSLPVEVAATVGSAARTIVSFYGIEWIEGTADVSAEIIAPQGDISETVALTVPRTNVSTGSGPLAVPASGPIPSVLLSQTGQAKVVVGAVVIDLATLTASGAPSLLGNLSLSCTLDPGQTGLVSSVQILPVASPTARPARTTQPAPTPTPTPTPTPSPTPTQTQTTTPPHSPTPAPSPTTSTQNGAALLRRAAPFARSFPGIVLLALFLVCAAILVALQAALEIFRST
jgi:hypothetical protein